MGSLFKRADAGGKGGRWYAAYTDHTGRRVVKATGTREKKSAQAILDHWESEAAKRRSGTIDPRVERATTQAARPIAEHQKEFIAKLTASGDSEKYIRQTNRELTLVVAATGAAQLRDLTAEGIEKHLNDLKAQGLSPRKIASVITSVKGFLKWAVETDRVTHNPLARIKKPRAQTDRRLERRPFTVPEWKRFIRNCQGECLGVPAPERRLLYETALQTALRANELRSLTADRLHLKESPPFVLVSHGSTKNKQLARQYITPDLAARLAKHAKKRTGPLFTMPPDWQVVDMVRHDLAAAGIPDKDASGRQIDFHAIRHTCGTWLAQSGVHPKAIQSIMRHSDIRLTIETYGHLFPNQEAEAVLTLAKLL